LCIKQEILETLDLLKNKRPIFHSEDDFKFAFSKILSEKIGNNFDIRLEKPQEIKMTKRNNNTKIARVSIDIFIIDIINNISYPIELKYKTKKFETSFDNENYELTEHGATDIGRFSFRKDIFRIEQLLNKNTIKEGYFIVITNEAKYLENILHKNTLDKNFSFHNGITLEKFDKSWNYKKQIDKGYVLNENAQLTKNNKLHWTSKGDKFYRLNLKNEYSIEWKTYSIVNNETFHIFMVEIR
jgi:hypothetical protein